MRNSLPFFENLSDPTSQTHAIPVLETTNLVEFHPPRQNGSGMLSNTIVLVWRKWRRPPSCCYPGGMKYIEISPPRFVSRILFNTMHILCIRFKGMHVCKHVCSPGSQSKVEGDTPIPGEGRSFIVEMSEM